MPASSGLTSHWPTKTDQLTELQTLSVTIYQSTKHKTSQTSTSNLQNPIYAFHNWIRKRQERCNPESKRVCIWLISTLIYCRNKSTGAKVWFNFSGIKVSSEACRYTNGTFVQTMYKNTLFTWFLKYCPISFTQYYSPILAIVQCNAIITFNNNGHERFYWTFKFIIITYKSPYICINCAI